MIYFYLNFVLDSQLFSMFFNLFFDKYFETINSNPRKVEKHANEYSKK